MEASKPYNPTNKVRVVSAASLFDGHDAAINIMRRIIQRTGCEVIHLGHDRSVDEVVTTAIQEDVQAIAMTSYQGGHNEYFRYMKDLLEERGAGHIKIFGGGGGTIGSLADVDLTDTSSGGLQEGGLLVYDSTNARFIPTTILNNITINGGSF